MAKEMNFFIPKYLFHISKGSLTCRKILRHRTDVFTSLATKGVIQIVIALKNQSPWPDLNSLTSGLTVSTLAITRSPSCIS
jgi:hypothetical protein